MTEESERMRILEQVEKGELTADEGIGALNEPPAASEAQEKIASPTTKEVLEALDKGEISAEEATEQLADGSKQEDATPFIESKYQDPSEGEARKGRIWKIFITIGVGLIVLSAIWMASLIQSTGYDFWFFIAWFPFAIGLLFTSIGWASRNASWLSLNINSSDGARADKLNLHIPLPLGILKWAIFRFEHRISGVNMSKVNELLTAKGPLKDPIVIQIEDDDGDAIEAIIT